MCFGSLFVSVIKKKKKKEILFFFYRWEIQKLPASPVNIVEEKMQFRELFHV